MFDEEPQSALLPHRALKAELVLLPHIAELPQSALLPHMADWLPTNTFEPHRAELPHMAELPHKAEESRRKCTQPHALSYVATGDLIEPALVGGISVLEMAAWRSR